MDSKQPPESTRGDKVHAIVKGVIGAVPLVGSIAAEAFALAVAPPLQKRQQAWMEELGTALLELEKRVAGFRVEALKDRERFVTVAMQATSAAIRTHNAEKLAALRNAVLNAAVGSDLGEDEETMFVQAIDRLTPTHMQILCFMSDPPASFVGRHAPQYSAASVEAVLEQALPQLAKRSDFYRLLVRELHDLGFSTRESLSGMQTGGSLWARTTNDRGERFLRFIRAPAQ